MPSATFAADKHSKTIKVMKRILLSAVLLLACGAVQAQFNIRVYNMSEVLKAKPIDKVLFTAQYDLSFVGDTAHEDKHIDETMIVANTWKGTRVAFETCTTR